MNNIIGGWWKKSRKMQIGDVSDRAVKSCHITQCDMRDAHGADA